MATAAPGVRLACGRVVRQWERIWHHALPVPTICFPCGDNGAHCSHSSDPRPHINGMDERLLDTMRSAMQQELEHARGDKAPAATAPEKGWEDYHGWLRAIVKHHAASPLLLRGAVQRWPCVDPTHPKTWQGHERWLQLQDRDVALEAGVYTDSGFSMKSARLKDFVSYVIESEQQSAQFPASSPSPLAASDDAPLYLAQQDVDSLFPELCEDFRLPLHLDPTSLTQKLIWIGPSSVVTPLHRDPSHNLFCQVRGTKRIVLVDASRREPRLLPSLDPRRRNTSTLDLTAPTREIEEQSPGFCELPRFSTIVCPGDVLFIPRDMWHFVEGVDAEFVVSLSFMFDYTGPSRFRR
ncbi:hypothetical protein PTSG_04532 [Salpingoeca rosetta]|uniref:JmjC domain-containing protein n=1 Tax=Salpingoeca rosetta (strain ATCC 50818 / BSB-021) TaxID=946362 RepID=F2U7P9_SALR5|nr:uncharacterized protein PTSG_04532 [Salpingoeca rosetta]EGD72804.1 hypothetical protein PTSG_04532 [Salpingoeca rosetta]|eukprot:XP_004994627.1 hypothetical protein PTSG_04532 [Salpingoeca rosetta]